MRKKLSKLAALALCFMAMATPLMAQDPATGFDPKAQASGGFTTLLEVFAIAFGAWLAIKVGRKVLSFFGR